MEEPTKNQAISNNPILNYAWEQKKNGRSQTTIETATNRLQRLAKLCDLNDPEQVKATLANLNWKNSTKHHVAMIYSGYIKFIGRTWTEPKYTKEESLPLIPTEQEIDALIACGTNKTAALLQLLKETGARIGEISFLRWIHIDQERKTIYITPEKGSNARILPISNKLLAMLGNLPKTTDTIFQTNQHGQRRTFEALTEKGSQETQQPTTPRNLVSHIPTLERHNRISQNKRHHTREDCPRTQRHQKHNDLHKHRIGLNSSRKR